MGDRQVVSLRATKTQNNVAKMGSVDGGDPSRTASIYKNPFEVPKDQLIRQLFEFPARIAACVQSQTSDGNGASELMESPFLILAAKLKVRDEMEARNLVSSEKMSGPTEPFVEQQPRTNPLMSGPTEPFVEQQPRTNPLSRSTVQETSECALETRKVVTSGLITYRRRKRKVSDQSGEARMARAEEGVAPTLPASTSSLNQHDAASFIIQVIRTLRHTRHGNAEKLFELLSVEHFPLDKCGFLEELIWQAYCYNKDVVAKQLAQYRNEICQAHPQESR